jgi:hypothetical protein
MAAGRRGSCSWSWSANSLACMLSSSASRSLDSRCSTWSSSNTPSSFDSSFSTFDDSILTTETAAFYEQERRKLIAKYAAPGDRGRELLPALEKSR